ncbi:MAG: AzlC family ABC transporter permease [Alphaproteobacteria bacterium]|nr:AzlC family ABC transporter permease [Alphaproteobacteria bacterium]
MTLPETDSPHCAAALEGARDTIPMIVGALPFALIFGTLAAQGPLAAWHGQAMSALVFAGSAQFIALGLVASHTGLLVIWLTTFVVNLRHMLYGANLLPAVAALPLRWRLALGFLLTDETFAVVAARRQLAPADRQIHWYFLGSGLALYVSWNTVTLVGLLFGSAFPQLQSLGLEFAIVATFVAIVVPQLNRAPHLAAAIAAGTLAYLWQGMPYKLGLLASVAVGVAVGLALNRLRNREAA